MPQRDHRDAHQTDAQAPVAAAPPLRKLSMAVQRQMQAVAAASGGVLVGFDTSTPCTSLAVVDPQHGLFERTWPASVRPCAALLAGLSNLLQQIGRTPTDLKGLVVGLGPGSFTGLRVGLATAKGLALGVDLHLYGASSLQLAAAEAGTEAGAATVLAVQNARHDDLFAGLYHITAADVVQTLVPDAAWKPTDLQQAVIAALAQRNIPLTRLTLTGTPKIDGWEHVPVASVTATPRAVWGIVANLPAIAAGHSVAVATLIPQYLRLSEPERRRILVDNGETFSAIPALGEAH